MNTPAPMEYEDIFQEMGLSFTKAAKAWNPEYGVSFTAYLGRCIWNDFNRIANESIDKKMGIPTDPLINGYGENDDELLAFTDLTESFSYLESPEKIIERLDHADYMLSKLSPEGRQFVEELIDPSEALRQLFNGMREHVQMAKEQGDRHAKSARDITPAVVARHMCLSQHGIQRVKKEVNAVFGEVF